MRVFNKKRLLISGVLSILVIVLLVFVGTGVFTYSKYETHLTSQNSITTAAYLLDDEYQTINVKLPDVIPDNGQYTYSFSVSNYNDDVHSDTNLKYRIHIRTTTNLKIDYDLYNSLDINNATSVISNRSLDQDTYGTYFNNFVTDYRTMLYSEDKTDNYTILFNFHIDENNSNNNNNNNNNNQNQDNYRDAKYSGIAELIEITIESKQIISTDA